MAKKRKKTQVADIVSAVAGGSVGVVAPQLATATVLKGQNQLVVNGATAALGAVVTMVGGKSTFIKSLGIGMIGAGVSNVVKNLILPKGTEEDTTEEVGSVRKYIANKRRSQKISGTRNLENVAIQGAKNLENVAIQGYGPSYPSYMEEQAIQGHSECELDLL